MKKRVLGLSCFCIGLGMVLVIVMPVLGWILTIAVALIGLGYMLVKC